MHHSIDVAANCGKSKAQLRFGKTKHATRERLEREPKPDLQERRGKCCECWIKPQASRGVWRMFLQKSLKSRSSKIRLKCYFLVLLHGYFFFKEKTGDRFRLKRSACLWGRERVAWRAQRTAAKETTFSIFSGVDVIHIETYAFSNETKSVHRA